MKGENIKYDKSGMIHIIITQSYLVFLLAIILGVIFDFCFHYSVLENNIYKYLGLIMIILATTLVYWAQSSSHKAKKNKENIFDFFKGPYKYIRNPSYLGVAIMSIGFGLLIGSLFSFLFSLAAYFFVKGVYVGHEEKILEYKHGENYLNYKKKVR